MLRRLEEILHEGYEGVGWTIFKAELSSTITCRNAFARFDEYINGPEAPTSGDELTFFITREIMREFAPRADAGELLGHGCRALGILFAVSAGDR